MEERDRRADAFQAAVRSAGESERALYDRLSSLARLLRMRLGPSSPALVSFGVPVAEGFEAVLARTRTCARPRSTAPPSNEPIPVRPGGLPLSLFEIGYLPAGRRRGESVDISRRELGSAVSCPPWISPASKKGSLAPRPRRSSSILGCCAGSSSATAPSPGSGSRCPTRAATPSAARCSSPSSRPAELGRAAASLPDEVILLPRPTEAELRNGPPEEVLTRLWRAAFHAAIHLEIERRSAAGGLTAARIRERIHRIGETEFDEVRLVLRHDESLLPPYDDRETFTEFAALYLELRSFNPGLLDRLFPTLRDRARVDGAIDIDRRRCWCGRGRAASPETPVPELSYPPSVRGVAPRALEPARPRAPSSVAMDGSSPAPTVARLKGQRRPRRAARARGARGRAAREEEAAARRGPRQSRLARAARLTRALRPEANSHDASREPMIAAWTPLAPCAGARRVPPHAPTYRIDARLLLDLQSAAVARERPQSAVDLVEFVLSFGRRPIVRPLPAAVDVRVARCLRHAEKKLHTWPVDSACLRGVGSLVHQAAERAEENVRLALRPRIVEVLDAVGLTPKDAPERVARAKLTEELLDQAAQQGFLGIGHLRDALSRNQLKLHEPLGAGRAARPAIRCSRPIGASGSRSTASTGAPRSTCAASSA